MASSVLEQSHSQAIRTSYVVYIAAPVEDKFILSCGGSIISPRVVLTSARCLVPELVTYIIAGSPNIDLKIPIQPSPVSAGQIRKVETTMVHEKFGTVSEYDYDVALASFQKELEYDDTVSSIQLSHYWAGLDDQVLMFGWEHAPPGSSQNINWVSTQMACRSKGLANLAQPEALDDLNISTDGVLFVKDQVLNKSMCHGFTGSPLVVGEKQIGIASLGVDYNCQGLNAISSIRRHIRWIEKNKALLESKTFQATSFSSMGVLKAKNHPSIRKPRIRNGTVIDSPEQFPFLVGLAWYISDDPNTFEQSRCTGSILTQWIILTAAHCIKTNGTVLMVYAGIVDERKLAEGDTYQHIRVDAYRQHPNYTNSTDLLYDIGLLLLSSPLRMNTNVAPVCQLMKQIPPPGTLLHLAGWGTLGDGTKPKYPSWMNVTVSNRTQVDPGTFNLDTFLKPSGCTGDSGGAYFNADHVVAGVHSHLLRVPTYNGSCDNIGSVSMSTAWVLEWLYKEIVNLEDMKEHN